MQLKYCLLTIVLCFCSALGAASLAKGDSVIIYGDGTLAEVAKLCKKELRDELKQMKVKIDERGKKSASIDELTEKLGKEVLKKKPSLVLVTVPLAAVYDYKKHALSSNAEQLFEAVKDLAETIQKNGIAVVMATPALAGEVLSEEDQVNVVLDQLAEMIRAYCKEHEIACCHYRKVAVKHIKSNRKTDKKAKDIMSKKGVFITKEGAGVLSGAMKKALGLTASGIDSPLVASDRVVFFKGNGSQWAGEHFTHLRNRIEERLAAQYAHLQKVMVPKYSNFKLGDSMFQPHDHSTKILAQKARVVFIQLLHRAYDAGKMDEKYDMMAKKISDLAAKLSESPNAQNIFFLNEPVADLAPDAPLRKSFERLNAHLLQCANEHGLRVFDMHALIEEAQAEDPAITLWRHKGSPYYSHEFLKAFEDKICETLGVK